MINYSQNNEQEIILNHFKLFNESVKEDGTFLDLGMNDGKTLSNTYALALIGWNGLGVEASPKAYQRAIELYKDNSKIQIINSAITAREGMIMLHESSEHLGVGDVALLSTVNAEEMKRWDKEVFTPVEVMAINFDRMIKISKYKTFDFISMDIEGMELEVLPQMDLKALGCKMICVEFNGKEKEKYDDIIVPQGYQLIHQNAENLIYVAL